jgi:hypothetical protein
VGISHTTMKTNILHQRFCNFPDARTARVSSGVSEKWQAIQRALYNTNVLIPGISERTDLQQKNQRPPMSYQHYNIKVAYKITHIFNTLN